MSENHIMQTNKQQSVSSGQQCRIGRPQLVRIVDWLCIALLLGTTVYAAYRYATLPERIPIHYNARGVIDGYGSKGMIWLLITIMWIVVGFVSAVERFPKYCHIGFMVTEENYSRVQPLMWRLMNTTKLIVAAIFAFLVLAAVRGGNLPVSFLPVAFLVLGANIAYWAIRVFSVGHA